MYAIRSYYDLFIIVPPPPFKQFSELHVEETGKQFRRITSYNVCYTKLLRIATTIINSIRVKPFLFLILILLNMGLSFPYGVKIFSLPSLLANSVPPLR